jgi:phage antirepressor YoqD-like protein
MTQLEFAGAELEPMPRTDRDRFGDRVDVLDKVKALRLLPDRVHVTLELVANYYEVPADAIEACLRDNRAELESNGYEALAGERLSAFKAECGYQSRAPRLGVFNRRAVMRVGFLLRDSAVARDVRDAVQDSYETPARIAFDPTDLDSLERLTVAATAAISMARQEKRRAELAEAKVAELEPKADLADTFLIADGSTRLVREAAKLLGLKERDLRRFLLDERLIFPKHAQCGVVSYDFYAKFAHYFVAKEKVIDHTWGSCSHYTLRITARGIELIKNRLARQVAIRAPQ